MFIPPINQDTTISFGYKSVLKDMYKAGKLPEVKVGLYGGKLSKKNVTYEHIKPRSFGGEVSLKNGALATKENNNARGNDNINNFLDNNMLYNYLVQFKDLVVEYKDKVFNGNGYIMNVIETLKEIGYKFGNTPKLLK